MVYLDEAGLPQRKHESLKVGLLYLQCVCCALYTVTALCTVTTYISGMTLKMVRWCNRLMRLTLVCEVMIFTRWKKITCCKPRRYSEENRITGCKNSREKEALREEQGTKTHKKKAYKGPGCLLKAGPPLI